MAALYEAYTLCGLVPAQNFADSGVQGIEPDRDEDRVIVTDSARSVTVYKVNKQSAREQHGGAWTDSWHALLQLARRVNTKRRTLIKAS